MDQRCQECQEGHYGRQPNLFKQKVLQNTHKWKGVNADYKAALTKLMQSGTHSDNFYNFCDGKLDVFYLWKFANDSEEYNFNPYP